MEDVAIKEAISEDKNALCAFLNGVLEHRMNKEDWDWEYETYNKDKYSFVIIKSGGKFMGSQGFIPVYLVINKISHLTGKSENSFVDSSLRGRGLFEKLYEQGLALAQQRGQELAWGFTALIKVWRDRLGFMVDTDSIYEASLTLRPFIVNEKGFLKKIISPFYRLLLSITTAYKISQVVKGTDKKLIVQEDMTSENDIEVFYKSFDEQHPNLVRLEYSKDYIDWRIKRNSTLKYKTIYIYNEAAELVAYSFVNITNPRHIYLTDVMFKDNESAVLLLKEILVLAGKLKSATIKYFGNNKNVYCQDVFTLFKKAGGNVYPYSSMNFVLKNISRDSYSHTFEIKNWLINGLYTEGYRI